MSIPENTPTSAGGGSWQRSARGTPATTDDIREKIEQTRSEIERKISAIEDQVEDRVVETVAGALVELNRAVVRISDTVTAAVDTVAENLCSASTIVNDLAGRTSSMVTELNEIEKLCRSRPLLTLGVTLVTGIMLANVFFTESLPNRS